MDRIRVASLCFVVAVVLAPRPTHAQGPGANLNARVAALEAAVAKLEGNIVASDLAGTYNLVGINTTMDAAHPPIPGPASPASITTEAFRGTLTLNVDGTGVTSAFSGEGSTLTQGTWAMTGFGGSGPDDNVTWTYANGVITITFLSDGDEIPFVVALGGRFLIMAYAPFHPSEPSSNQFLFIATRLQ